MPLSTMPKSSRAAISRSHRRCCRQKTKTATAQRAVQSKIDGELQPRRYVFPIGADDCHDPERHRQRAHAGDGPQHHRPAVGRFPGDDAARQIAVYQSGTLPAPGEMFCDHSIPLSARAL
jgi:hypothetical protein